jgi:hypothetical protein
VRHGTSTSLDLARAPAVDGTIGTVVVGVTNYTNLPDTLAALKFTGINYDISFSSPDVSDKVSKSWLCMSRVTLLDS